MKTLSIILSSLFIFLSYASDFNVPDLDLFLNQNGTLKSIKIAKENHIAPSGFNLFSIIDPDNPEKILPVTGSWKNENDKLLFNSSNDPLQLKTEAIFSVEKEMVKVNLTLKCHGNEKGAFVRFALPVNAKGWTWWDDIDEGRVIKGSQIFENTKSIRANADLPEFAGQPELKMGYYAQNFCTVISGNGDGLGYAVPLDQPRIFRTGYDSAKGIFYIIYDIGFSKDTKTPMQAELNFYLLPCSGKKGMRSALDKYYRAFPEFFHKNVKREGQWLPFSDLHAIDNVDEFDIQFRESNGEGMSIDDKLGVYTLSYYAHAGMIGWLPNYKPGASEFPEYEVQLKAMIDSVAKENGRKGLFIASAIKDADGKYAIRRWSMYGNLLTQSNMDPNLAYGRFMLDKIKPTFFENYYFSGAELDGFYYDGLSSGLNYNRDHFKYAEFPPIWNPTEKQPVLYNFFSSVAFARDVYNKMRELDKYTMLNGSTDTYFMSPYVDISGLEIHRVNNKVLCQMRTNSPLRPFTVALKGDFIKEVGQEEIRDYMEECVAKGIYPGFFDIGGAQGPGSRYWEHSFLYDRDRMMHRKYQSLCKKLNNAGWQPVTTATLEPQRPELYVERFGNLKDKGDMFITVINKSNSIYNGLVQLPVNLFTEDTCFVDEISGLLVEPLNGTERVSVSISLAPNRLMVLRIGNKNQLIKLYLDEITENINKYRKMITLDKNRPEQLKYWRKFIIGDWPQAVKFDGKSCMKLADSASVKNKTVAVSQFCMPYQKLPEPLRLKINYYSDNVSQGSFKLVIETGHVNTKTRFTERKTLTFDLPLDGKGWQEKEFTIISQKNLRSVNIRPVLHNAKGTVYVDWLSLTSADGKNEYVKNPFMKERYLKLDNEVCNELNKKMDIIQDYVKLASSNIEDSACANIIEGSLATEKWIKDKKIADGSRRELRELEILMQRMWTVTQLLTNNKFKIILPTPLLPDTENKVELKSTSNNFRCKIDFPENWKGEELDHGIFKFTPRMGIDTADKIVIPIGVQYQSDKYIYGQVNVPIEIKPLVSGKIRFNGLLGDNLFLSMEINNQSAKDVNVIPEILSPAQWEITSKSMLIPAKSTQHIKLIAVVPPNTASCKYLVHVVIRTKDQKSPVCYFEQEINYIPAKYNLVQNPNFEDNGYWSQKSSGGGRDTQTFNSGKYSMRLHNVTKKDHSQFTQQIKINQKTACPIDIRCYVKTQDLKGKYDKWASLYIDFFFADGTNDYGKGIKIEPGTNDWEYYEMVYKPEKPVKTIGLHLMLSKHTGTIWFDDIYIGEDPSLKDNLAIHALPSVDSQFSKDYKASTINDGETRTNIHWNKESWASSEDSNPHWAALDFGKIVKIGRIEVLWSMDSGKAKTSRRLDVQIWRDEKWMTIKEITLQKEQSESVIKLENQVNSSRLRLFQPPHGGSQERQEMMWIREIKVYEE